MIHGSVLGVGPTLQQWRVARLSTVSDVHAPGRIAATTVRSALAVFLAVVLWRASYAGTSSQSGLSREQAVTFMVLTALLTGTRMSNRWVAGDTVVQRMQLGTILYRDLRGGVAPAGHRVLEQLGRGADGDVRQLPAEHPAGPGPGAFAHLLPIAFLAYLPASAITGQDQGRGVPGSVLALATLIGLAGFVASRLIWNASLQRHQGVTT